MRYDLIATCRTKTERMVRVACFLLLALPASLAAQSDGKLTLLGDVRLRLERDWASTNSDGTKRDDRDRLRGRLRFGFTYQPDDVVTVGGRLRTGSRESQQSPHVTFGDDFQPKELNVDKLFVSARRGGFWSWGGKNSFPFWKHNELFWDDDATPEGLAAGYRFGVGGGSKLGLSGAYFLVGRTEASREIGQRARLLAGQAHLDADLARARLNGAVGLFSFHDDSAAGSPALAGLDHRILLFSAKAEVKGLRKPLSLAFDVMENVGSLPVTATNNDQTTGWTVGAQVGSLAKKGEWLAALTYAHIEEFAVVPSFAQDDWVRWGSATQTRSSNFAGWEWRLAYAFQERLDVMARYYDVEGIALRGRNAVANEDGKRLRIDVNVGF